MATLLAYLASNDNDDDPDYVDNDDGAAEGKSYGSMHAQ